MISFATIRRQFGFRSIEIGRWVTEQERDRAAGQFHRALCDLSAALQVPDIVISLRETLGLQFGIGGRPGVSAHYTPAERKLALAKNAGAGSLAHEWFHSFDHYVAEHFFTQPAKGLFGSTGWLQDLPVRDHPLNQRLAHCYRTILLSPDGRSPSEFFLRSRQHDESVKAFYYARPEELCARAFEAFIEDEKPRSRFLVRGTRQSEEARLGLYPVGREREQIHRAFTGYFHALGSALMAQAS